MDLKVNELNRDREQMRESRWIWVTWGLSWTRWVGLWASGTGNDWGLLRILFCAFAERGGEGRMGLHFKQLNHYWSVKDKIEIEKPISLKEVWCKNGLICVWRNTAPSERLKNLRVGGRDPFNSPECVTEIMGWRSNQSVRWP